MKIFFKLLCLSFLFFCSIPVYAQIIPLAAGTPTVKTEASMLEPAIAELASPRLVLDTFLKQMESYASGDSGSVDLAIKCLDLAEIPEFIRKEQGISLAIKLHAILSKTKIEFWKVPNKETGTPFALRSDEQGQILIEKVEANWRFSKLTIRNIPELFFRLKDEKILRDTTLADPQIIDPFSLRQYVPEFFSQRLFSAEYWQILGFVVAFFLAWLAKHFSFRIFRKITSYFVNKFEAFPTSHSISGFVLPLAYLAAAFVYHFCIYMLDLDPVIYTSFLRILEIIKIAALFIFLLKAVDLIAEILQVKPGKLLASTDKILIPLGRTVAKFMLFFAGLVLVADLFSINLTGLLAGLGIGGLALALAAKDTVENLFGSLTVLIDKPFHVGDSITIEGVSGVVENIGIRSTRLRTPENSLLTIPNSKLISVIVDNLGARKLFRTRVTIAVTYETPLDRLEQFCEAIRQLLNNHANVRSDFFVHFNEFASSSLNILIQAYFQTSSLAIHLAKQEEFFLNIIRIARHLEIDFAYPAQRQINAISADLIGDNSSSSSQESLDVLIEKLSAGNR